MPSGNRAPVLAVAVLVLAITACSGGSESTERPAAAPPSPASVPSTPSSAAVTPSGSATPAGDPLCRPGEGKTVTDLPDVRVAAVTVPARTAPAVTIKGIEVPARTVPGFTIPAQTVDGGCRVTYEAPGGCLGKVELSAVTIPPVSVPARTLPPARLPDGATLPAVTVQARTAPAVTVPGDSAEQVCQLRTGRSRPAVIRASVVRRSAARPSLLQPSESQRSAAVQGSFVPAFSVPAVFVPAVFVPAVYVKADYLPFRYLPGQEDVQVASGKDATAYVAPGDVLFATGRANLRPAARTVLRAVAKQIEAGGDTARITVEGHTDSRAGDSYNLGLSRRRAQTVATWLERNAGVAASRVTVTGLGETAPTATNATAAGRQKNRRVVITVEK